MKRSSNSREGIVEDGSIIVPAVGTSDDGLLSLCGRCSGNEASDSEGSGDFLGEVHLED